MSFDQLIPDPIQFFGLPSDFTPTNQQHLILLTKSFRKLCLKYHPDKSTQDTNDIFQALTLAYAVLKEEKKFNVYRNTQCLSEANKENMTGDFDWNDYFKELWSGVVNVKTIDEFRIKYKGSAEERQDVLDAYELGKGKLGEVLEHVPLSTSDDVERYKSWIQEAVAKTEAKEYRKEFKNWTNKEIEKLKRFEESEEKMAEEAKKALGVEVNNENDLQVLLRERQEKRSQSIIESLELKYGKQEKAGKKRKRK